MGSLAIESNLIFSQKIIRDIFKADNCKKKQILNLFGKPYVLSC